MKLICAILSFSLIETAVIRDSHDLQRLLTPLGDNVINNSGGVAQVGNAPHSTNNANGMSRNSGNNFDAGTISQSISTSPQGFSQISVDDTQTEAESDIFGVDEDRSPISDEFFMNGFGLDF